MSPPSLPPELTDYIISFLRKDNRTLCACARVCKAWLPASRTHLFDSITFKVPRLYTAFVEHVLGSPRADECLALVRGMAVVSPDGFVNRYLASKFLRDMHGRLPHLRVLRLSHVDWGHLLVSDTWRLFDAVAGAASPLPGPFPRLTKLAVSQAVFSSEDVLTQLVVSLPSLETLSLRKISFGTHWRAGVGLDWSHLVRDCGSAPYRSTRVETVWIDGSLDFAAPCLAWFAQQFPEARDTLRELGCTPTQWISATASTIEALKPAPAALGTLLIPFPTDLQDAEPPSLAHLTNLTRLNVLLMGYGAERYPSPASWTAFARMLDSLRLGLTPRAQSLSVALCCYPARPSDWLCLEEPGGLELLDLVLAKLASREPYPISSRPECAGVEVATPTFKFVCYVHQPRGSRVTKADVDGLVREKLRRAARQGVVSGRLMQTLPGVDI